MAHAYTKAVEVATPRTSLTPCILDADHSQLELLSGVMEDIRYDAITTSDQYSRPITR